MSTIPVVPVVKKAAYLSNRELLVSIRDSKAKGEMTPRLASQLQLLCARYGKKGNYINYTYNEDMQAYAMLMLVRTWNSFKLEKSDNPFAFFTQCIKNSFSQYLNHEKRQRNVRDAILVDQGLTPSFGYAEDCNDRMAVSMDDEEDFDVIQTEVDTLKNLQFEEDLINTDPTTISEAAPPITDAEIEDANAAPQQEESQEDKPLV